MKILLDLSVLLDVIQRRKTFYEPSAAILSLVTQKKITGCVPGHALTTIYYIVARYASTSETEKAIDWLLTYLEIVPEDRAVFQRARSLMMDDFEDAVVASASESVQCTIIVTRNLKDFAGSPVPPQTPEEFLVYYNR